jgi:hypothetical protein
VAYRLCRAVIPSPNVGAVCGLRPPLLMLMLQEQWRFGRHGWKLIGIACCLLLAYSSAFLVATVQADSCYVQIREAVLCALFEPLLLACC